MTKEGNSKARAKTIFSTVHPCQDARRPAHRQWSQVSCPSPRCADGPLCRRRRSRPGCSSSLALSQGRPWQEWSPFPLSFQNLHDILPEKKKKKGKTVLAQMEISWLLHRSQNLDIMTAVTVPLYLDCFLHICIFSNYSKNDIWNFSFPASEIKSWYIHSFSLWLAALWNYI